jgi:hypothetical protein
MFSILANTFYATDPVAGAELNHSNNSAPPPFPKRAAARASFKRAQSWPDSAVLLL